jgi:DNA uptake protein ComE-like DNA-binding protein
MALYPNNILRCQHIKMNGTQCGSPSLRETTYCYYHIRYHWPELEALENNHEWRQSLPTLEDANSVQISLAKVMEQLVMQEIDHKTAALLLYALQTASMNLKRTSLEPELPTQVVIDRQSVARRPLGASAWSRVEGQEYDDLAAESDGNGKVNVNANAQESLEKYLPGPPTGGRPS